VIGVCFAGAIGLAALLRKLIARRELFSLEDFLFGEPLLVRAQDLVGLLGLAALTAGVLVWIYNPLLLSSFNPSLALSRRVRVRFLQAVFVMLLAVIVNLSLRAVGVLLINALLIVPGATAMNLARNMRQLLWVSLSLGVGICVFGQWVNWEVEAGTGKKLGIPGTIILLSVLLFFLSTLAEPLRRWRAARAPA